MDFYPTGTPNTYQQGHSPTYQVQGTIPIPYAAGQSVSRRHPFAVHFVQLPVLPRHVTRILRTELTRSGLDITSAAQTFIGLLHGPLNPTSVIRAPQIFRYVFTL